ncbi:MAG: riboflavin synthase [Legionellales bacterium]|nr:riboflavin synthase [Legionellales bacterium]
MYTGIIDHVGKVLSRHVHSAGIEILVASQFNDLVLGESIAVNGVCVTVNDFQHAIFSAQLSPETLNVTNLNMLAEGSLVNLERSLAVGDRLGGHIVQGHVDQTAIVTAIHQQADFREMVFSGILAESQALLLKKGSISVNGVSLTINEVNQDSFTCMLIPHTLAHTNLNHLTINDTVNIEFDWLVKIMLQQFAQRQQLLESVA